MGEKRKFTQGRFILRFGSDPEDKRSTNASSPHTHTTLYLPAHLNLRRTPTEPHSSTHYSSRGSRHHAADTSLQKGDK
ncbi:hypothetical protein E2C01_067420 [Portunus trituberculatus]|uniref:Uncharacterized protein n=1 Tax=Portunus trituberculatus TaxID=210409 RepID=A0A5B7HP24_PORTR|nr:hypothetical protein [Portunus trituberculatus]